MDETTAEILARMEKQAEQVYAAARRQTLVPHADAKCRAASQHLLDIQEITKRLKRGGKRTPAPSYWKTKAQAAEAELATLRERLAQGSGE